MRSNGRGCDMMTNLLFVVLISTNTIVESFESSPGQRVEVVRVVQRAVISSTNDVVLSETRRLLVAQTNWVESSEPRVPAPHISIPVTPPLPPIPAPTPLPTNPVSPGRMPVRTQLQ